MIVSSFGISMLSNESIIVGVRNILSFYLSYAHTSNATVDVCIPVKRRCMTIRKECLIGTIKLQ